MILFYPTLFLISDAASSEYIRHLKNHDFGNQHASVGGVPPPSLFPLYIDSLSWWGLVVNRTTHRYNDRPSHYRTWFFLAVFIILSYNHNNVGIRTIEAPKVLYGASL